MEPANKINNRIEELYNDHKDLTAFLERKRQLQLRSRVEDTLRKSLLIAVASYFEVAFTETIVSLYREETNPAGPLAQFVKKQAIGRRFAQLFEWDKGNEAGNNANRFYRLFGEEFSTYMKKRVDSNKCLRESVQAFLEIGHLRNRMVHGNYADVQFNHTVGDIYNLYKKANIFIEQFPLALQEFMELSDCQPSAKRELNL